MGSPKRILVVEDEILTAMALGSCLQEMGHAVLDYSATGEDAVQKAKEQNPDLIIMDVGLAGKMDGIEAARIINSDRQVPIVIITGYTSRIVSERGSDYRPAGYLIKPINFDDIKGMIERIA